MPTPSQTPVKPDPLRPWPFPTTPGHHDDDGDDDSDDDDEDDIPVH